MMVFNNFNSSFNRYYNPPRPSVTTQNYQESIKYADDMKYGGNGDGKVSATELTSIKKIFDYATDYYRNMYETSGDAKYMTWSDHYSRDLKATNNMINNFSIFSTNVSTLLGGADFKITKERIEQLADKDGNGSTLSLNDLAKTRFNKFDNDKLSTNHYEDVVKYGDDVKYGGNGDGKLNDTELATIKKTFDYATTYYKNKANSAQTTDEKAKFTEWSNYYANDAKAAINITAESELFMKDGDPKIPVNQSLPPVKNPLNLTLDRLKDLAAKDGDLQSLSIQDLAKAQYPNFLDETPLTNFPLPFPYRNGQFPYGGRLQ